jgi:hypothetical protein
VTVLTQHTDSLQVALVVWPAQWPSKCNLRLRRKRLSRSHSSSSAYGQKQFASLHAKDVFKVNAMNKTKTNIEKKWNNGVKRIEGD